MDVELRRVKKPRRLDEKVAAIRAEWETTGRLQSPMARNFFRLGRSSASGSTGLIRDTLIGEFLAALGGDVELLNRRTGIPIKDGQRIATENQRVAEMSRDIIDQRIRRELAFDKVKYEGRGKMLSLYNDIAIKAAHKTLDGLDQLDTVEASKVAATFTRMSMVLSGETGKVKAPETPLNMTDEQLDSENDRLDGELKVIEGSKK